ncbi:hypothetical protein [Pandoraea sp. NPDC090278]|uniref:hypothetical protein n=1 Tax=Pandoraea sp. NPDC090278 TaxID=3364391 RepID=UPI00383BD906
MTQHAHAEYQQHVVHAKRLKSLPRRDVLRDYWAKTLLIPDGARRFLTKHLRAGDSVPINFAVLVADCILAAQDVSPAPSAASPRKVQQIRTAANRLHETVSNVAALTPITTDLGFQSGLDVLRHWEPSSETPSSNNKGNPERRAYIEYVALRFYENFREIHVEAVGEIVMLVWPNTQDRTVRHVLSTRRQEELIKEFEAGLRQRSGADTVAQVALARMRTDRGIQSLAADEEKVVAAILQLDPAKGNTELRQALHAAIAVHTSPPLVEEKAPA